MTMGLRRALWAMALGLALRVGVASAQTTGVVIGQVTDAFTGQPVSGARVVATSPSLQGEQAAVTDEGGSFRLTLLPPGQYRLAAQREGYRPAERGDVAVRVDKTIRADLAMIPETVQMEEVVVSTGLPPVINLGSAETGTVVTKETMERVPMGRDSQAAAAFAPQARRDQFGFGFAGAQSPENNYLLDGLNVTDPRFGTLGSNFLTNFFEEIDVKTGAFMPEYGRSTGGILSSVLKSGSNELHGSVWTNLTPRFLLEPDGQARGRAGEAVWAKTTPRQGGGAYDLDFGFELGGPIVKDRLWFYVGFAPVLQRTVTDRFLRWTEVDGTTGQRITDASGNFIQHDIPGTDTYYSTTSQQYQTVAKLTYLFNEDHNLTVSTLWAPRDVQGFNANGAQDANGFVSTFLSEQWSESIDVIARYAGKFLERHLVVEAVAGIHSQYSEDRPGIVGGIDQGATPFIRWGVNVPLSSFESVPSECNVAAASCFVNRYLTGGYGTIEHATLRRFAGRLSASYLFSAAGSHDLKGGVDIEVTDFHDLQRYSGGAALLYRGQLPNGDALFLFDSLGTGSPGATSGIDTRARGVSEAFYLQDSWQILSTGLTLNAGLRWELQSLEDTNHNQLSQLQPGDVPQKISINDNIAPRVQAIYDFTGRGRGKIAANWGRFYENIPLHVADRAFGGVTDVFAAYRCSGVSPSSAPFDPRTTAGCSAIPGVFGPGTYAQFGGVSPVAPDLKGMYVDQFGLAAEYELISDLSVGIEWQARRLGRVIEDMSSDGSTFFIANPGESQPWVYNGQVKNPQQTTGIDPATGRPYAAPFPKPQRDWDGITLKLTKNLSRNWLAQASYTYSVLRGNYTGFFRPEKGLPAPTPNLTTDYDLAGLMQNRMGLLPGDITHQFKLFGAYVFNLTPRLDFTAGAAVTAQSGTPLNALGSDPFEGRAEVFLVPRGQAGRSPAIFQLDLKGQLDYRFSPPYAIRFSVEVFNVLNSQTPVDIDQNYTFDFVQPIPGARCQNRNGANGSNPIGGVQADCPDLKSLKTVDGRPVTVNPNYGKPLGSTTALQLPISVRFGLALTF